MSLPPQAQLEDATLLQGDGIVELFEVRTLGGAFIYAKANDTVTFQGKTYEGIAVELRGAGRSSDEQAKRPTLSVANPEGLFSQNIAAGDLDFATVVRRRVLRADLLADIGRFHEEKWLVRRCTSLTKHSASFELSPPGDRFNALIPARLFILPEFPLVTMQ